MLAKTTIAAHANLFMTRSSRSVRKTNVAGVAPVPNLSCGQHTELSHGSILFTKRRLRGPLASWAQRYPLTGGHHAYAHQRDEILHRGMPALFRDLPADRHASLPGGRRQAHRAPAFPAHDGVRRGLPDVGCPDADRLAQPPDAVRPVRQDLRGLRHRL